MSTKTRFEKEAKGNSEMVYLDSRMITVYSIHIKPINHLNDACLLPIFDDTNGY